MATTSTRRWIALLALGGAAGAAALATYLEEERAAQPTASAAQARPAGRQAPAGDTAISGAPRRERQSGEVLGEPFGAREQATQAARNARVAVAPPAPPPFPYRYGGQVSTADGSTRLYLALGNDLVAVERGDVLEGGFKVTAITADTLEVLHVPSGHAMHVQYSSLGGSPGLDPAATLPEDLDRQPAFRARAMLRR